MWQRSVSTLAAVLCLGLLAAGSNAGGKKEKGKAGHFPHHEEYEKCAKACNDCQRICDACATHCAMLVADGKKDHLKTLMTCRDCADFCAAAAEIVARGGPFADLICKSCADACNRCGKACEKFKDDEMMRRCAQECFRCEKACREMLTHVHHHHEGKGGEAKGE